MLIQRDPRNRAAPLDALLVTPRTVQVGGSSENGNQKCGSRSLRREGEGRRPEAIFQGQGAVGEARGFAL